MFALIALGLAAKTRADGGSAVNIPEAFAITGATALRRSGLCLHSHLDGVLVFVFALIGGLSCVAGVWQEGFMGLILRDTVPSSTVGLSERRQVWGFCFIGLWLIGAYCGLASTLVTINLVLDRFKVRGFCACPWMTMPLGRVCLPRSHCFGNHRKQRLASVL